MPLDRPSALLIDSIRSGEATTAPARRTPFGGRAAATQRALVSMQSTHVALLVPVRRRRAAASRPTRHRAMPRASRIRPLVSRRSRRLDVRARSSSISEAAAYWQPSWCQRDVAFARGLEAAVSDRAARERRVIPARCLLARDTQLFRQPFSGGTSPRGLSPWRTASRVLGMRSAPGRLV
jgi:hypothetical protein